MDNQKPPTEWEALQLVKRNHKPKSVSDTADFAKRLLQFEAETDLRRTCYNGFSISAGIAAPFGLIFFLWFVTGVRYPALVMGSFFVGIIALGLSVVLYFSRIACPSAVTALLTQEGRPQALGAFLRRLDIKLYPGESYLLWWGIIHALRRISPDEANALPRDVRDRLNQRLAYFAWGDGQTEAEVEFCCLWLKVLEQVGSAWDVSVVASLVAMETPNPATQRIQRAALDCLPRIKARLAAQEPGRTLLRASIAPPVAPETLLRPAAKSNPTAPNQLLRPAEPEDET